MLLCRVDFAFRDELAAITEGKDIGIRVSHLPDFLIAALVFRSV